MLSKIIFFKSKKNNIPRLESYLLYLDKMISFLKEHPIIQDQVRRNACPEVQKTWETWEAQKTWENWEAWEIWKTWETLGKAKKAELLENKLNIILLAFINEGKSTKLSLEVDKKNIIKIIFHHIIHKGNNHSHKDPELAAESVIKDITPIIEALGSPFLQRVDLQRKLEPAIEKINSKSLQEKLWNAFDIKDKKGSQLFNCLGPLNKLFTRLPLFKEEPSSKGAPPPILEKNNPNP